MRAAVLHETGRPLRIEDVDLDGPRTGEAHIRMVASGVCRSDLAVSNGTLRSPLPVVPGHEAGGVVSEVGEGVSEVARGDRVIVALSPACRRCPMCLEGHPYLCIQMVPGMIGSTMLDGSTRIRLAGEPVYQQCGVASFAEEVIVCARACIRVPDDVALERACLLGCGALTGAGAVFNTAALKPGMSIAVIGCGGVGLAAVQAARIAGADTIIAIDVDTAKLELARELGATNTIDGREDVSKAVRSMTGFGVNVAIEAIGKTETIESAWSMLRPAGVAIVIGMPAAAERVGIRVGGFFQAKRIHGCVYGSADPHRDIPRLIDLYRKGDFRLDAMVSDEIPLERAQDALDDLAQGRGARHVIVLAADAH